MIAAEFLKLRTVRTVWILLAVGQLVIVAGVSGKLLNADDPGSAVTQQQAVGHIGMVSLFSLLLGIVAVAGEHRHRTVTDVYLATPRRGRVLLAKLHWKFGGLSLSSEEDAALLEVTADVGSTKADTDIDLALGQLDAERLHLATESLRLAGRTAGEVRPHRIEVEFDAAHLAAAAAVVPTVEQVDVRRVGFDAPNMTEAMKAFKVVTTIAGRAVQGIYG